MDLLLPIVTNTAEFIWDTVFGKWMGNPEGHTKSTCTALYSSLLPTSQQPSTLKFKTEPAGRGMMQCTGKSQPSQSKPQAKALLLPVGRYQGCQRQWKHKIQIDCLFPHRHENHSSSINNALGLICQEFQKNEFKTKKTSSIFMIMPVKSVGWKIRLHTVLSQKIPPHHCRLF